VRTPAKSASTGTTITVTRLHPQVEAMFSLESFRKELLRRIGSAYTLFLKSGVKITVNGQPASSSLPELHSSSSLVPARKRMSKDKVDILIMAGITAREDRTPHGWYIFCNGRMVVEADRTDITGWLPPLQWHSKYNHFAGFVYFRSRYVDRLPWTTTKDGVNLESEVYQAALGQMRVIAKPILAFLSKAYSSDSPAEDTPEFALLEKTPSVPLDRVARGKDSQFVAHTPVKKKSAVRIAYDRPAKIVEDAKQALGETRISNREVGERTFDYFVTKEVK
jgi:hypothetical protein